MNMTEKITVPKDDGGRRNSSPLTSISHDSVEMHYIRHIVPSRGSSIGILLPVTTLVVWSVRGLTYRIL